MGNARAGALRQILSAAALAVALLAGQAALATPAPAEDPAPEAPGKLSGPLQSLAHPSFGRASADDAPLTPSGPDDPSADGPGTLIETSDGVLVQAFSEDLTDALVQRLRDAGARIVDVSKDQGIATVSAAANELEAVAGVEGVRYVREVLEPLTSRADAPAGAAAAGVVQATCGAAHSEGDTQLNAVGLRTTWDTEGAGVKVGVLSDTWNQAEGDATTAAQDVASGDLPGATNNCPGPGRKTPVQVLQEGPDDGATDEGRAMGQVVHDLAPAANIAFATAFNGDTGFASNIRALRNAGASVIVDDIFYFNEPNFQNGLIGAAVEDVVASGATYFSAIGNETVNVGGKPVGSYEAPAYRPMACPANLPGTCHDFDTGLGEDNTFRVKVNANGLLRMSLKWNEPWDGVVTDLNLHYLVNGVVIGSSDEDNPGASQQPFEFLAATAGSAPVDVDIVVQRPTGSTTPRFKLDHVRSVISASEYSDSVGGDIIGPNALGHAVAPSGVGVGAIPYNNSNAPEPYSNRGPATWYWGPVEGNTAAEPLAAPQVLNKPDLVATDGGQTTFFYDRTSPYTAPFRFYGTSQSAPHAAAVAALLKSCNPSLTPAQIVSTLKSTAAQVGTADAASVGAGRVDAKKAGDAVCLPVAVPTFNVSDASVVEGNGGFTAAKNLVFTVSLSKAAAGTTSVKYATANGTASSASDYTAKALTALSFTAGQVSKTVSIPVKGDTVIEPDETMSLELSSPVGAPIGDGTGVGTIVTDDLPPIVPDVTITDGYVVEGNGGFTTAKTIVFTVSLSAPAPGTVSLKYATVNGSAIAPGDYTAKGLTTLSFSKGQTSKTITITIKGDKVVEPTELFTLELSSPIGLNITDGTGLGTIVNDD